MRIKTKTPGLLGFTFAFLGTLPATALTLPPWPEAIRGDWKETHTPEPLPPFCRPKQMEESEHRLHLSIPGLNHFCDSKVKHFICWKYQGKDKAACLSYLARGIYDAIEGAQQKSPNHPLVPYLYTEYAKFLAEAGDHQQATQAYLNAIRKNKRYLPAYVRLADLLIKTKQYDEAEKTLQYALKIQKNKRYEAYLKKQLAKLSSLRGSSQ